VSWITAENARDLIAAYDIVADGSDNFPTRFLVNDALLFCTAHACLRRGDGIRWPAGDVQGVHRARGYPCYRCLFAEAPPPGSAPSCSETESLRGSA